MRTTGATERRAIDVGKHSRTIRAGFPSPELVRRYDVSGPRYTSYPTALHFGPLEQGEWEAALTDPGVAGDARLSLYVHFPFCPSLCLYCGCNVQITRRRERIAEYLDYLRREIQLFRRITGARRRAAQIHWGGGSPSYLAPDEIRRAGDWIRAEFEVTDDAELGVEIDPRGLTIEHVQAFRDAGFNRASIGVQDFDVRVQQAIGRRQSYEETSDAVRWLREAGFGSVNVDLIYGLPGQTAVGFEQTLQHVASLSPDRLAVFNFAYVPALKPHQRAIPREALPDRDAKLEILHSVVDFLTEAGYLYVGLDHFARPGDELATAQAEGRLGRNFQGYTTGTEMDLFGFGVTAISSTRRMYAQNRKSLTDYYAAIDDERLPVERGVVLSGDDRIRRRVINDVMCNLRIDIPSVERECDIEFSSYFPDLERKLEPMRRDGLVELSDTELTVLPQGRFFLRNVAMAFDAYMKGEEQRYSRTV